jgi:Family of unknown function (DUF5990)
MAAHFRIIGTDLPGMKCAPGATPADAYGNVHVGVQRGRDVVDLVRGDAVRAVFELDVDVGAGRFRGPYVHGRDGQRFIYLSWGDVAAGQFAMFRRAKLHIDHLDANACSGHTVEGRLTLRDHRGHPLCASVRPPRIEWVIT